MNEHRFIRALGLRDVILMNIVAVVGLRWIARGARMGPASVTLWVLACLAFFVPLAAAVSELSSRHPEQGGLYVWTRRAFGPVHGFICGWCLWVNNLFYFPSLLLFGAANALAPFGASAAGLADSRTYATLFVLGGIWATVGVGILGLNTGKWLQNIGSAGIWLPAALLIAAGAYALATFGSATPFTAWSLVPPLDEGFLETVSLWSAMCFAFSGFEITALVGQEVKRPERTIPLGVLIGGAVAAAIYIAGSVSVLIALPVDSLRELRGITDAIDQVGARVGLPAVTWIVGALIALSAIAGTLSWMASAARVPFAAGVDRVMPPVLGRLHPRFRTPHIALIVQGVVATAIFLVSVFFAMAGARPTIQDAYDILVNLTILIYFVPYLYLFLSLPRLRRLAGDPLPGELRIPGGWAGLWVVALTGLAATVISLALVFVPPPGTTSTLNYEGSLLLQALAVVGVGFLLFRRERA
ncbi:MAG TPA: APC family permease [Vicinamibacterales bacterium]|nr:APC family permease [Vicinamibacterales bacterium]